MTPRTRGPVSNSLPDSPLAAIRIAVQTQGLAGIARALSTSPATLGSYLAGTARAGTAMLLEARFRALLPAAEQPRP